MIIIDTTFESFECYTILILYIIPFVRDLLDRLNVVIEHFRLFNRSKS